jgi:UDP-GlcNAc:undecaprenyl-phosphate GlcNAc-1-phosphate transferase
MLVPVFILSVPIFDTIFVMTIRRLQGRKIFEGGQDHTSHHLVTLGLSPKKTVLLLYLISIAFGLIAILYSRVNLFVISTIGFLASIILLFLGIYLFDVTKQKGRIETQQAQKRNNHTNYTALNTILMYKRRIVEVLLDFFLICIAYYSAYFLRFEGPLFASNLHLLQQSLGWVIFIKMSIFFMFGLYRGVWRYIGISDFITMFKVVTLGTIASVLFLTFAFRFHNYSRAVFFIDWLILLFLVTGSRFLFRFIGEFFSKIQNGQTKILIFGAGDTGEMVIREIKRNKALHYNPIGFIDDDSYKAGNKIHGIPILGSREKIKDLVKIHDIKEIIIAMPSIDKTSFLEITRICEDCGLTYRKIKGILDKEDTVYFGKEQGR